MKHVTISTTEAAAELANMTNLAACHAAWSAVEVEYYAANEASKAATRARIVRGHEITPTDRRPSWGEIDDATFKAAVKAEKAADQRYRDAEDALMLAEAPDWRAWVVQFQVAREHHDDLLNPLDVRNRKEKRLEKEFPGSLLAADIVTYALAAHAGVFNQSPYLSSQSLAEIPRLVAKLIHKVSDISELMDGEIDARLLRSCRGAFGEYGLILAYRGAVRLAERATRVEHLASLSEMLDRSDQLFDAATHLSDETHSDVIGALDNEGQAFHEAFINGPISSTGDALAKLRWLKRGFTAGKTGNELTVLEQFVTFLGADPKQVLADPWCDAPEDAPQPALLAAE